MLKKYILETCVTMQKLKALFKLNLLILFRKKEEGLFEKNKMDFF